MLQTIALQSRRAMILAMVALLGITVVLPVLISGGKVSAAPTISQRRLTSTSAVPGSTTQLSWSFDTPNIASNADYIEIEFCDTPLQTCTTANTPSLSGTPTATLSGPWTTTGVTATTTENGLTGGTANQIQIDKANADAAGNFSGLTITLGASDVTNNATENRSYYTRMRIYSDAGTTLAYEGVFAQSTSQTLTVNARVQERLDFCVGATTVNNATAAVGDCTAITAAGGTVDVGNVENGNVNVSPVDTDNGGSETNGIALIRTNAVNGASIAYRALSETASGALKVPGATCNALPSTATTDQCFNTSSTMGAFTAGTERFGMAIAGVNCQNTNAYSCSFAGDVYNLRRQTNYNGNLAAGAFASETNQTPGTTTTQFAWDANPASTSTIASSTGTNPTGFKVIDNEALILKFAATAGVTTPTGAYSVQADFIATTTF